nr:MAG TPA: hypothetical protein [Caudoviricetes sp.]
MVFHTIVRQRLHIDRGVIWKRTLHDIPCADCIRLCKKEIIKLLCSLFCLCFLIPSNDKLNRFAGIALFIAVNSLQYTLFAQNCNTFWLVAVDTADAPVRTFRNRLQMLSDIT